MSTAVELMRGHAIRRLPVMTDGTRWAWSASADLAVSQDPGSVLAAISRAQPDTR